MEPKSDIYSKVTESIVKSLEAGVRPWSKSWNAAGTAAGRITRPIRATGEAYTGINVVILWSAAMEKGYGSAQWMTYNQASELGAHVRKGEKGTQIVYVGQASKTKTDDQGNESEKRFTFLKTYTVFNVEQIEGLPAKYCPTPAVERPPMARLEAVDVFIASTRVDISHGGDRACYSPTIDAVRLPVPEAFSSPDAYYATALHELAHWTGHSTRLDRLTTGKFGSDSYAEEELVAELAAAFLCADLQVTSEPRADHASYLQSWLTILKADTKAIFKAASAAEKACGYLDSLQPAASPVTATEEIAA